MGAITASVVFVVYFVVVKSAEHVRKDFSCDVSTRIDSGVICGRVRFAVDGSEYASFRGIPYGKPPLGELRFKELEPVEPWGDILYDATGDSPACPQNDFSYGRIPLQPKGQSEDCIYLNLHVPYSCFRKYQAENYGLKKTGLPVLVFIHGGGFQSGSGLTDLHGPEYLMTKTVLVITFNYRLNVFGYLSLNSKEIPGNQGLRDILTLLRWVKRNVRAFGGDPDNVTLMGHSAGGSNAHLVSLTDVSRGLFQRLILMSGNAAAGYYTASPKYAKFVANLFLQELGINSLDPTYIHKELIKIQLLKIMNANTAIQYKTGLTSFCPVIETRKFPGVTRVLPEDPLTLIAKGGGNDYPAIVSFTINEMFFAKWLLIQKNFLGGLQQDPSQIVQIRLVYNLPESMVSEIARAIYQKYFNGTSPMTNEVMNYLTDSFFIHPAFKVVQWRAAMRAAPTYMYQYAYDADFSPVRAALWVNYTGAAHIDDLATVFRVNSVLGENVSSLTNDKDDRMKLWMVQLITNFMKNGTPTGATSGESWTPVTNGHIRYLNIQEPYRVVMSRATERQKDFVNFFDSYDPTIRNITWDLGAKPL